MGAFWEEGLACGGLWQTATAGAIGGSIGTWPDEATSLPQVSRMLWQAGMGMRISRTA